MAIRKISKVLVLLDISREYSRMMLRGISRYASMKGHWHCFGFNNFDNQTIAKMVYDADGIIARDNAPSKILNMAVSLDKPAVLIRDDSFETYKKYPWPVVIGDNRALAKMAIENFYGQGFKKLAFCGYSDKVWSNERMQAFKEMALEKNISVSDHCVEINGKIEYFSEMAKLRKWISKLPKPIGILAASDDIGRFVLEAAKYVDVSVPGSVAVMGVDNDELVCELCDPPLSSISRNVEKAGFSAAEALDELVNKRIPQNQIIYIDPVNVVTRESTSILAVDDTDILKAVKYIKNNYRSAMVIDDVAEYVMVSPKTLHRKFRKVFGVSVFDKINEFRIETISQLLSETNLPIAQIADQVGELDYKHLSRIFKKYKGMTPSEYREKYQLI